MIPDIFYIALIFLFFLAVGFFILYSSKVVDGMKNNQQINNKLLQQHIKMHQDHAMEHNKHKKHHKKMRKHSIYDAEHVKQHQKFLQHREQYIKEREPSTTDTYNFKRSN